MRKSELPDNIIPLALSFFAIYIIWGASYLFIAFAVEDIPPFLLSGMRFVSAGLILGSIMLLRRKKVSVTKRQFLNASLVGVLFLTCGNGGITWALQFVDSGLTALLVSAQPLILLFMLWAVDRKPLPLLSWIGVFMGMIGIYLLLSQNQIVSRESQLAGIGFIFLSLLSWGSGSLYAARKDMPTSHMANTAIQMIVGGLIMVLISLVWEDTWGFDFRPVRMISWIALGYLAILAGAVTFTAFNYLLRHVSAEKVVTSTYVNPVIALILGWIFRDELLTPRSLVATAILLTGVYFINRRKTKTIVPVTDVSE